ncbi:MAG: hypothetical protein MUP58_01440 [Candidatus Nanohaloarchaeota archaeon QJJ-9]|nr:hypothetical protein [Candidatus Nanohaloarchaeota archaeon QJJ-9]
MMEARLELELNEPEASYKAIRQDLRDSKRAKFDLTPLDEELVAEVEAESLGVLRGSVNTILKLSKLSDKILGD